MSEICCIEGINGPVVTLRGGHGLRMADTVYLGSQRLLGEIVSLFAGGAVVQVYEEVSGLKRGEAVEITGRPLSIHLGPGLLGEVFDGIARPLEALKVSQGPFIRPGLHPPALDPQKTWDTRLLIRPGDILTGGEIFAETKETAAIMHRALVPPDVSGQVERVEADGPHRVTKPLAFIKGANGSTRALTLQNLWPIRQPRPIRRRLPVERPLITGQRVIDTLFPIPHGGTAAIPGPFGAGKTQVLHQLARWVDADIILYVGCGERGNEMTQALEEFSSLFDPKTGLTLLDRTVLIANTSNMPTAAREASIYTGITIAEYYRDMGYAVVLLADSTSRWAEALREISGRLEEMPAEEGHPAYLSSRLAGFYERAGRVETLAKGEGSVTVIGAISPQGGDLSEPVTQNTQRFTRGFWALNRSLAQERHFPAIHWLDSYSEYGPDLEGWYLEQLGPAFYKNSLRLSRLLQKERDLLEIAKLIGQDVLPNHQRLILEIARVFRLGYLQQNAFDKQDAYTSLAVQNALLETIFHLYDRAKEITARNIPLSELSASGIFDAATRLKLEIANQAEQAEIFRNQIDQSVDDILEKHPPAPKEANL